MDFLLLGAAKVTAIGNITCHLSHMVTLVCELSDRTILQVLRSTEYFELLLVLEFELKYLDIEFFWAVSVLRFVLLSGGCRIRRKPCFHLEPFLTVIT